MRSEFTEIERLLGTYFDGLHGSDTALLRQVFHPQARYVTAVGGELLDLSMAEYFAIVDERPSPASRNEARADRIVAIEFAGSSAAVARVNCSIAERHFTDLLSFVRTPEGWRIIAKVFHYDIVRAKP